MTRTEKIVAKVSDLLMAWRHPLSVLFVLVTIGLGFSATHVRLDPGFLKMIPVDHPYMKTMMQYLKDFSGADTILVNLHWTGKGDIYNKSFMAALQKATSEVFLIPGINRTHVSSLFTPNVYYIRITEKGFDGHPVVPAQYTGTPQQLAQIRNNVLHSGQIGILVANDAKSAMIRADLLDYDPEHGVKIDYWGIYKKLNQIRHEIHVKHPDVQVNVIGFTELLGDVISGLLGVFAFFALAFVITALLLYWYTRSYRLTAAALVAALLPVLWLIGVLPMIGYGIDPLSILVPFLIFSIGVSHAVQMTNGWRQAAVAGADPVEASRLSFRKLFIPGSVALLTNALGFAVIMLIDIPIVHELGITACIGVLLMIITNKMILPIIMTHLHLEERSRRYTEEVRAKRSGRVWHFVAECARPKPALAIFAVSLVLLGVSTVLSRQLVIGDSGVGTPELRQDSRYNQDSRVINSSYDIGVNVLSVIVEAKHFQGDSCLHYPVVHLIDKFDLYMRGVAGVRSVTSPASVGKKIIGAFNEGNPRWMALPRTQVGLTTASRAFDPGLGLNTENCRAIQVLIFTRNHEGATIAHIVSEVKQFIAANPVKGIRMRLASGNMGVTAATNEAVGEAEAQMVASIFIALALLCLITFRSWRAAVCVLVPLMLVSIFCNALMAMMGVGLKVATLPVVALGVGVGVDYGIYLFEHIKHAMREGADFHAAFYEAMQLRGTAAVFTAVTMGIGVATWALSALRFQADMGVLLAFMFLVNMLGAICLLPAMGAWFFRKRAA